MADLFILALFGHLVGDYFAQSKMMAFKKSNPGMFGIGICTIHAVLYAASVCLFLWTANLFVFGAILVPHWIIDRWSLASYWLKLIKGRSFEAAYSSTDKYREFDIAFTSIVYTVVDNSIHVFCLYLTISYLVL